MQIDTSLMFKLILVAYWLVAFAAFYWLAEEDDSEGGRDFLVFAAVFWPGLLFAYIIIQPLLLANKVKRKHG